MTRDEQLAALRAKLDSSKRLGGGYAVRIKAIEAEIARIENEAEQSAS